METWVIILTIIIVLFFVAVIAVFYYRDRKNKGVSKYISKLIFDKYNARIDKIIKAVGSEELEKILNESKLQIEEKDKLNESLIFENIRSIDAVEDNFELLKKVDTNHIAQSKDTLNLLKKHIKIFDLSEFEAKPHNAKCQALKKFEEKLRKVELEADYKKVLSATPCYKFNYVFMFLGKCALKIDLDNIFAVEMVDYKNIGIRVWLSDEGWTDFDGTYDLNETKHEFPKSQDENDLDIKEQVWQKNYVLSFTYKEMRYDVTKSVALLKDQQEFDKLTTKKF
ncbi:MAG TPA: hypothetical protein IAC38_00370 [Candidatus Caccovivens faecavium]|nr:hypothetical protein [Candidatus Caccovivens faecavium]